MRPSLRCIAALLLLLLLSGCGSTRRNFDYGSYVTSDPRSVVVAPVVSPLSLQAREWFLATVTEPLAERGYYVFPVRMSRAIAEEAGFTGRGPDGMGFEEFSEARAAELAALFGADSVLFVFVESWSYTPRNLGLDPVGTNAVLLQYRLTDASGQTLWTAEQGASLTRGGGSWLARLWNILTDPMEEERQLQLAREVNRMAIEGKPNEMGKRTFVRPAPMLVGPYHPRYEQDRSRRRAR